MNDKNNTKDLLEKALKSYASGDFRKSAKIVKELKSSPLNEDMTAKLCELEKKLTLDRAELIIGTLSFLLLSLLYVWFGFIKQG